MPDILDDQWGYKYCVGFYPTEIGAGLTGLRNRVRISSWLHENYTVCVDFEISTTDVINHYNIYRVLVYLKDDEMLLKFTLKFFYQNFLMAKYNSGIDCSNVSPLISSNLSVY